MLEATEYKIGFSEDIVRCICTDEGKGGRAVGGHLIGQIYLEAETTREALQDSLVLGTLREYKNFEIYNPDYKPATDSIRFQTIVERREIRSKQNVELPSDIVSFMKSELAKKEELLYNR